MRSSLPKRSRPVKHEAEFPLPLNYTAPKPRPAHTPVSRETIHTIVDDVKGLLLIALAIFILTTNLYPQSTGFIGKFIVGTMLLPLFGKGMYLLPLFIALWGAMLVFRQYDLQSNVRKLGGLLGFLTFITIAEIFRSGPVKDFLLPQDTQGGGVIGYLLSFALQKVFGPTGTYVFILVFALASVLLLLNAPLYILKNRLKNLAVTPAKIPINNRQRPISPPMSVTEKTQAKNKMFGFLKDMFGSDDKKKLTERPIVKNRPQLRQPADFARVPKPYTTPQKAPGNYRLPPLSLLQEGELSAAHYQKLVAQSKEDARVLEATLASFKIEAKVQDVSFGPAVTRYELQPGAGVRVNRIAALSNDIALNLAVGGVRIEAPVPGKSVVGIEVPNAYIRTVMLSQLLKTPQFREDPAKLLFALGQDIGGKAIFGDVNQMPHLLIAGATGSGKSVCLNALITSILFRARPDEVKFLMIDPKRVELTSFNHIPHLVAPVIHEPDLAAAVLKHWALKEMRRRYDLFARTGVKDIARYNNFIEKRSVRGPVTLFNKKTGEEEVFEKMPYIVIVIDELADLMMVARDVEMTICRIAQLARATGMHLVIATQRPSVDVITGLIKANIPSRIAFAVQSQIDSRTILDSMGAEKLLGKGDMLYSPVGFHKMVRLQGVYVTDKEINTVVRFVREQQKPQYVQEILEIKPVNRDDMPELGEGSGDGRDPLFEQAAQIAQVKPTISYLQRKLGIGYNRAANLMESLQEAGIVKGSETAQPIRE
jgi:S-DNA-T family DNA segregation ATPase FtsK/SpoIIIE